MDSITETNKKRDVFAVKKLESKVKTAVYNYDLINNGDLVIVGLSGGKDSFALLDLLIFLGRVMPLKFRIVACHIRAEDMTYRADEEFMKLYCQQNDIPFHIRTIKVDYDPNGRKPACFICSWKRRKAIFALARELGCNKIALGHHLDDAVETLLMNMIHHSSISSLPPKLSMFNGELFIIRPLILAHEKELIEYVKVFNFPEEVSVCLFEDKTNRELVRNLIRQTDGLNRSARENIFRSMGNICDEYIVKK